MVDSLLGARWIMERDGVNGGCFFGVRDKKICLLV